MGVAFGETAPADALESSGDAACLAVRLRALALMLCLLLAQAAQFELPNAVRPRVDWREPAGPAWGQAAPLAPDTS
jgi:hypothetical protein